MIVFLLLLLSSYFCKVSVVDVGRVAADHIARLVIVHVELGASKLVLAHLALVHVLGGLEHAEGERVLGARRRRRHHGARRQANLDRQLLGRLVVAVVVVLALVLVAGVARVRVAALAHRALRVLAESGGRSRCLRQALRSGATRAALRLDRARLQIQLGLLRLEHVCHVVARLRRRRRRGRRGRVRVRVDR